MAAPVAVAAPRSPLRAVAAEAPVLAAAAAAAAAAVVVM
jgi:hypothetical protein